MLYLQKLNYMSKTLKFRINKPNLVVTNTDNGEIISGVSEQVCSSIDEFIMFFLASLPKIETLDGNTLKVLMWCWKLSTFNPNIPEANIITNDKAFKNKVREGGSKLTDTVINKAVHELYKAEFLKKRCKGSYFLNPEYFFKGTLVNRAKVIHSIKYNGDDLYGKGFNY